VVGHGIEASAAMGQLRAVLLELLESGLPLEEVVLRLDVFATRHRALRATTVCIAVLDQHTGALRYVTLGHPPPLLLAGDGGRYLDPTGGAPLGTGGPGVAETGAANVAPGETLVLFTDGLIERPGRSLADGSEELLRVASAAAGNQVLPAGAPRSAAERISEQAVEVLTRSGYLDDVTVLAAERRAEPVAALHLELAAEPSRLGTARGEVARWLTTLGADGDTIYEMQLAVSEALANAIEHAHTDDGGEGRVRLDVALLPSGRLQCCITDDGHWSEPTLSEPTRGRGLALIRAVSDDLTIRRGLPGTEVTFERRLARPAAVTSATATGGPPMDEVPFHIEQSTGDTGAVVTVSGPIDLVTVERFTAAVLAAARGGAAAVTVDLAGVTHLASAGVRALYEVGHAGGSLRLWSPPGTPARLVIELVGLADLVLHSADSA
jgi:anti-anti-sigma factor